MKTTAEILRETKEAFRANHGEREKKNAALLAVASRLESETDAILEANREDVEA